MTNSLFNKLYFKLYKKNLEDITYYVRIKSKNLFTIDFDYKNNIFFDVYSKYYNKIVFQILDKKVEKEINKIIERI